MTAPSELEAWASALAAELGVDGQTPVSMILDVARDAAHGVTRPAAPISTYVLGLAVAQGLGTVDELAAKTTEFAARWAAN
ncbi:MAG TPA: DUF6457 domain-containing protein [Candidatus Lumbricidophila sp.]|nr:DUF6457 domain-containing protein [Candidatus Lumbricidophila sp.]